MKNKIIVMLTILFLITINGLYAQTTTNKKIYNGGVYGQTFEITEYSDGNRCRLLITMSDNKNKNTQVQTFDSTLPTVYYIWSKWFSSPSEYSDAVDSTKSFLTYSMNLDYSVSTTKQGSQFIRLEYDCSDLKLFFEIAERYNAKGRDYVLKNYLNKN